MTSRDSTPKNHRAAEVNCVLRPRWNLCADRYVKRFHQRENGSDLVGNLRRHHQRARVRVIDPGHEEFAVQIEVLDDVDVVVVILLRLA